jgi:hypothetical protein
MHGDPVLGYEVVPTNVAYTAQQLKLSFDEWDWNATAPQASAYKTWVKGHLVQGSPVVMFPICKGDSHGACGAALCVRARGLACVWRTAFERPLARVALGRELTLALTLLRVRVLPGLMPGRGSPGPRGAHLRHLEQSAPGRVH